MGKRPIDASPDSDYSCSDAHALRCELATETLLSSGKLRLKVTGSSMLPTIFPGDTLIIERAALSSAVKGDILLVGRQGRLLAHRLVDKMGDKLVAVTKGDSMLGADPAVNHDKVLGRVSLILRNGDAFQPRRRLRLSERAVAALAKRSTIATRIVVGVHGLRSSAADQTDL